MWRLFSQHLWVNSCAVGISMHAPLCVLPVDPFKPVKWVHTVLCFRNRMNCAAFLRLRSGFVNQSRTFQGEPVRCARAWLALELIAKSPCNRVGQCWRYFLIFFQLVLANVPRSHHAQSHTTCATTTMAALRTLS